MKILQLEDSSADLELIRPLIARAWPGCEIDAVSKREDFLRTIEKPDFDLILSDYTIPGFSGMEALKIAKERHPAIPFIFCSGTIGEDRAIEAIHSGATDYVLKDNLTRLVPAMRRALDEAAERRKLQEAESALKRSERRYRTLINAIAEIVWFSNADGSVTRTQPPWHAFTGLSEKELNEGGWLQTIHPEDRENVEKAWINSLKTQAGHQVEFRVRRADGSWRSMLSRGVPQFSPTGELEEWVGVCFDITATRDYERRLREKAEVIKQAQEGVLITDLEGVITFWNDSAERILGWSAKEMIGRTMLEFFEASTVQTIQMVRSKTLESGSWHGELTLNLRDRKSIVIDAHVSLIRDERGAPKARLNIFSDITERKQLEQQILRAQRMENLGLLASGISHDLNNILTPILMAAPLLQSRLSDQEDIRLIETLEQSAHRGAEMVKQILSFARGAGGDVKPLQPRHLLRDITRICESTFPKKISVQNQVAGDLAWVRGNPTQIHQVLLNLCVNARDAMPDGGRLIIRGLNRFVTQPISATTGVIPPQRYVVLEIADSGTGISEEVRAKMWEPFFTTKEGKGTGLGLPTVRGIVEDHHGFIDVETAAGHGTTFKIFLPAIENAQPERGAPSFREFVEGKNEQILVIDDEAALREMICATLDEHGFRAIPASSASDLIEKAARMRDSIRLLITDVNMPDMSGEQVMRIVRELIPGLKILVMSGQEDAERFGDRFIAKPFKPAKLLELINELLKAKDE
ncbi:MAG TPA: PAS domain S-box protein [Opitutaceae bacterium]|nr:PAS domain S-box protein [Opitutaceae bacterium]